MASTPKLFGLLFFFFFFFFCGKGCISTNLSHPSSGPMASPEKKGADTTNSDCHVPYHIVGEYCLLIDSDIRGTWNEVRNVCLTLSGELANLQDANTLYEISQYIKSNGMDDVSYWVGATDESYEGNWVWSSDKNPVKEGTPLWGHLFEQQPDGGKDQNCAALSHSDFFYMHDEYCDDTTYGVICQPTANEELMPISEVENDKTFNDPPNECPYEEIGHACLQVITEQNYNWSEARDFCDGSHTHLVKIDDANLLGSIYDYLTASEINTKFWIGGTDAASEGDWVWHDATPVKRATPFWDVNDEKSQEPTGGTSENCAYIWYRDSYFYRDATCPATFGIICQYDM